MSLCGDGRVPGQGKGGRRGVGFSQLKCSAVLCSSPRILQTQRRRFTPVKQGFTCQDMVQEGFLALATGDRLCFGESGSCPGSVGVSAFAPEDMNQLKHLGLWQKLSTNLNIMYMMDSIQIFA